MSQKRAIVFANGELAETTWLESVLSAADLLIAADGGLRYLRNLDLPPTLLIGDLDSASADQIEWAESHGTKVVRFPTAKDETDLELALLAAHGLGCDEITIVAGLGGRLDHTLANLSLLRLPALKDCFIRFEDGHEEALLIRNQVQLSGQAGDVVSLIPVWGPVEGVLTENLAYPLHHETLYPEHTRGISNVMTGTIAKVSISAGELLCIHTHTLPSFKEQI